MNDETREILETMKSMFDNLSSEIKETNKRLTDIETSVNERIAASDETMGNRLTKLEISVENNANKNVQLLAEGFKALADKVTKLDVLPEQVSEIKTDIEVIKEVVTGHSGEINRLAKAK